MKKIIVLFLLLVFCSCSEKYTFTEDNGALIRSDKKVYYPINNSQRYSDFGLSSKKGAILGSDIYSVKGSDEVVFAKDTYYVTEEYKSLDIAFENCEEFFFVPKADLDKDGKISERQLEKAEKLKNEDAVDFAFYVFYGREPEELGYQKGVYVGEVIAPLNIKLPLVSSYPVYKWSDADYSVEIDGTHYMLEEKWSKKIGIID